jgi:hypothetical protein
MKNQDSRRLATSVDSAAALAWVEDEFNQALTRGRYEYLAYLEAVLDELLFELEPGPGG